MADFKLQTGIPQEYAEPRGFQGLEYVRMRNEVQSPHLAFSISPQTFSLCP